MEKIDFRKYVNMEAPIFKDRTSDEVRKILIPDERMEILFLHYINEVMKIRQDK